jgi:signal transduction histidine kinase
VTRPRLTVRVRLTLLYTGLFTVSGAIIVAISYALGARVPLFGAGEHYQFGPADGDPANFLQRCDRAVRSPFPDENLLVKCDSFQQYRGAIGQRGLFMSHLLQYSLVTLAVVVALAALVGWIVAGRALRPVHRITAAARAASDRNLSLRVALNGPRDELRELAETFDDMLGRLETAFDGQRRFIANASHELRTPLAVMRTTMDVVLAKPDRTREELRVMTEDLRAAVDQAERLIGALLTLARNEHGLTVHEEVDLATAAENVLDAACLADLHVHSALEPAVVVGDPVLAERLVANLVDNAARYNVPGGDVWISTSTAEDLTRLVVANTGPVVSPADTGRLFRAFQRLGGRTSCDGFGLGLPIVASIAAVHHGSVAAIPRHGGGLTVTVTIPAAPIPGDGFGIHRPGPQRPGASASRNDYPDRGRAIRLRLLRSQ